jgi:hypothetical protein
MWISFRPHVDDRILVHAVLVARSSVDGPVSGGFGCRRLGSVVEELPQSAPDSGGGAVRIFRRNDFKPLYQSVEMDTELKTLLQAVMRVLEKYPGDKEAAELAKKIVLKLAISSAAHPTNDVCYTAWGC